MLIMKIQIVSNGINTILFKILFVLCSRKTKIIVLRENERNKNYFKFACSHMHMTSQKWECRR